MGDAAFREIFHPISERLLERCDAVLHVGCPSQGAELLNCAWRFTSNQPTFTGVATV